MVQANVNSHNHRFERLVDYLRQTDPDVVLIQEATPDLVKYCAWNLPKYKYRQEVGRWDNFGLLLLSRLPLTNSSVIDFPEGQGTSTPNSPTTVCKILLPGGEVYVINTHLLNAFTLESFRLQNLQVKLLGDICKKLNGNVIAAGDFNTTSWCYLFDEIIKGGGLRDGRLGFGVQATWPTIVPFLRIPIDHCLVKGNLAVLKRVVGPNIGSDHFPVYSEIAIIN